MDKWNKTRTMLDELKKELRADSMLVIAVRRRRPSKKDPSKWESVRLSDGCNYALMGAAQVWINQAQARPVCDEA